MAEWVIESFARRHDRAAFSCGKPTLDDFLRTRISQYEKRRIGKTYVAVPEGEDRVLGYYTLAAGSVAFQHLPDNVVSKLPRHPVPVVLLARLAVDQSGHGRGLGEGLLIDALKRSLDLSTRLGNHAVEVGALDESASALYRRYGFVALLDNPLHLYLPIATIDSAFG